MTDPQPHTSAGDPRGSDATRTRVAIRNRFRKQVDVIREEHAQARASSFQKFKDRFVSLLERNVYGTPEYDERVNKIGGTYHKELKGLAEVRSERLRQAKSEARELAARTASLAGRAEHELVDAIECREPHSGKMTWKGKMAVGATMLGAIVGIGMLVKWRNRQPDDTPENGFAEKEASRAGYNPNEHYIC